MPGLDTTGQLAGLRAGPPTPQVHADPSGVWQEKGHLVSPEYEPHLEAVRRARTFVTEHLLAIGLPGCSDDAGLMVSELAANAVLHARSLFRVHLRPTLEGGVRVEVHDLSPLPPVFTIPSATAMSGRGLNLVQTMAARWGSHPLASPMDVDASDAHPLGKIVWFELEAGGANVEPDNDIDELIAMWSDEEEASPGPTSSAARTGQHPSAPPPGTTTAENQRTRKAGIITSSMPALNAPRDVVVRDLPVGELVAAKEAVDDLLREVQLLLLATPPSGATTGAARRGPSRQDARHVHERELAMRLDATARDFEHGRRQVREQVSTAAAHGEPYVTLILQLPASAARQAVRYRDAVEEASQLGSSGQLLAMGDLDRHVAIRRRYLDEIVRQLS